jgi:pimeloyl-ACP methyl ester carboxylesterase
LNFLSKALKWDPRKVSWANVHEFDVLDPSRITVPTLVIHGEKDFYTDMEKQR